MPPRPCVSTLPGPQVCYAAFSQRDDESARPGFAEPKRAKHLLGVSRNDLMLGAEIGPEGAFET